MRPLAVLALFFAGLAIASPVEDNKSNEPIPPMNEARCRRGYERCIAV